MKLLLSTIALALGLAFVAPAPAQQALEKQNPTDQFLDQRPRDGIGVGFTNRTYEEIAEALRDLFPGLNVVVEDRLRTQKSPEIKMRNVTLRGILTALETASSRIKIEVAADNVVTIRTLAGHQTENTKPILRTFNLSGYLAGQDVKARDIALVELRELLAESWGMLQDADPSLSSTSPPSLRVHAGTQMLISVGTPEQLQVLEEIVYNLPGMSGIATDPATGAPVMIRPRRMPGTSTGSMGGGTQVDQRFLDRYGLSPQGGSPAGTSR